MDCCTNNLHSEVPYPFSCILMYGCFIHHFNLPGLRDIPDGRLKLMLSNVENIFINVDNTCCSYVTQCVLSLSHNAFSTNNTVSRTPSDPTPTSLVFPAAYCIFYDWCIRTFSVRIRTWVPFFLLKNGRPSSSNFYSDELKTRTLWHLGKNLTRIENLTPIFDK